MTLVTSHDFHCAPPKTGVDVVAVPDADAASVVSDGDRASGPRMAPEVRLHVPGGVLVYYGKDGRFTAECDNPLHGRCVATRFNRIRSRMRGRPVGFLAAWLAAGPLAADREEHWRPMMAEIEGDLEMRQAHRRAVLAMERGADLLQHEKDSDAGLDREPEVP